MQEAVGMSIFGSGWSWVAVGLLGFVSSRKESARASADRRSPGASHNPRQVVEWPSRETLSLHLPLFTHVPNLVELPFQRKLVEHLQTQTRKHFQPRIQFAKRPVECLQFLFVRSFNCGR